MDQATVTVFIIAGLTVLVAIILVTRAYVQQRYERRFNDWLRTQPRGKTRQPPDAWSPEEWPKP